MYKKVFTLLLLLLPFQLLIAQKSLLKNFPEGYTPDEIGRRISYRFVTEKHALHAGKWIGYPETFYWNGSLKYAAAAKDKARFLGVLNSSFSLYTRVIILACSMEA